METLRKNKIATPPLPAGGDVARYSLPEDDLPEKLHADVRRFLSRANGLLRKAPPEALDAAVAYTPVSWGRRPQEITLYAIGRFPSFYEGLTTLADITGELLGKGEVAPLIEPLTEAEWQRAVCDETPHFQRIERRGILIFERG